MANANEETVRSFLALFHTTRLNLRRIRAALAENARWQPVVPLSRPLAGRDAICREGEQQYRLYADCACEIVNIASNGPVVFTERVDRVRMLADNREVVTRLAGIFELDEENRIVQWRDYWDTLDIADQIGVTGEAMRAIMRAEPS